jgi:release factor family 2
MRLTDLQSVVRARGGFASVCLDVSRATEDADQRLRLRWKAVVRQLRSDGAPDSLIDRIAERVLEPTGHGGELSRFVIATEDDVLLDTVLPRAVTQADDGHFGPLPHLLPLVRVWATMSPYVLVKVDHTGADIVSVDASGLDAEVWRSEGGHDVIHKVPGGGWSHRRYQSRVEDSWERNVEQVVKNLDTIVASHVGGPVFLVGEPYARSVVQATATGRLAERLIDLGHGSRAAGSSDKNVEQLIGDHLAAARRATKERRLARLSEQSARPDGAAAMSLDDVLSALREAAVEALILVDRPEASESSDVLWTGPQPLAIGRSEQDVKGLGVDEVYADRLGEVLLRALIETDGDLELLDEPSESVPDGVGGLLRFDTGSSRS